MAIIEWRLGGEVRLRVVLPRELVAKRIEAERRAGTPGQIYIDNERFDDQELRIAEIEETLKVQNDLLQQIVKRLNAPGKPGAPAQAADPEMEAIKELLRRAEELSAGRSFSWGRELLHSFIAAKKEERGDG